MSIERLSGFLQKHRDELVARPVPFGRPEAMHNAVVRMRNTLRVAGNPRPPRDRITEALKILYGQGVHAAMAGHARFLCWALLVGEPALLTKTELAQELLGAIDARVREGQLSVTGWRGLLEAYFAVPSSWDAPPAWHDLREMLRRSLDAILKRARYRPNWMGLLAEHRNLLGDDPCGRYAAAVASGDNAVLDPLRLVLRVPEESWFWKELILAQVRDACRQEDKLFMERTSRLVPSISGQKALVDDALVLLLTRHAQTLSGQPSELLKSLAIEHWGSPHLFSQARWNLVDPPVKQMVQEWITREDLRDFFAVLQADGAADERRLEFWLRYVRQIEYAQFALGQYAYESQKLDYVELRQKRKDRIARLTDQPDTLNNAFIIKIKDMLFVEFGQVGNACYIYRLDKCPFNPTEKVLQLWKLKNRKVCEHNFSHHHTWEYRLEELLRGYGILPDRDTAVAGLSKHGAKVKSPGPTPAIPRAVSATPTIRSTSTSAEQARQLNQKLIIDFATKQNLVVLDHTSKSGALWVLHDDHRTEIARMLRALGMSYKPGKGWWI